VADGTQVPTDLAAEAEASGMTLIGLFPEVQEKCIRLFVLNVAKNVKFPSNQPKENLFFVETALPSVNHRDFK